MNVWRKNFVRANIFLIGIIFGCVLLRQSAYADTDPSISISIDTVTMNMFPGTFDTANQTITASTTNIAGYTIKLINNSSTSSLVNVSDSTKTFPTFTIPSGETSVPVGSLGYGYGYSIDAGSNYHAIPAPSTYAELFKTNTSGTNQHVLTFGAKVPLDAIAGTYTNTFDIAIVANLESCPADRICYHGNNDDGTGTMPDQTTSSNTETMLLASNFSRTGYGFVGWNTSADGTGTNYGPNQTITTGDISTVGMQLYAKWLQSSGTIQNWHGCEDMQIGDIIALTDSRDNNTYAIAKQADDKCWTMENLRLDLSDVNLEITINNTNRPSATFISSIANHPASSDSFCETNTSGCIDQIKFNTNNINRNYTAAYDTNDATSSWYSYGVYYNWYTSTAGHGTRSFATEGAKTDGDICPAGWHLPTGYKDAGELSTLDRALGGTGKNVVDTAAATAASARWRSYPLNFIYSGEWRSASALNRNGSGGYYTSNTSSDQRAINLWIRPNGLSPYANTNVKYRGQTIRCVASENFDVMGDIHYDANGGSGTMTDDTNVNFGSAVAKNNGFTKANARFLAWNTKADGTGIVVVEGNYVASAAIAMELEEGDTLTLYAIWESIYNIAYDGNNADAGVMSIVHTEIGNSQNLVASNFSRTGYGFVGWSPDISASTKLINGQNVTIYGPNQTITIDNTFLSYADSNNTITLYAVWIPADNNDTLQTFDDTKCSNLSTGDIIALTDTRDSNTYAVAKLADGNCWMIENLRLDPSTTTFTSANTNNPTSDFISDAPSSASSRTLCGGNTGNNSACVDQIGFNSDNLDRSLTASHNATTPSSWYSYGIMYNWYTATAGNGKYSTASATVAGDICPAGWRLPTSGTQGELAQLNNAVNNGLTVNDRGLRLFPNNFIYSGDFNQTVSGGRGTYGRLWSATSLTNANAYRLGYNSGEVTPVKAYNKWDTFGVRCIVQNVAITNDWFTGYETNYTNQPEESF